MEEEDSTDPSVELDMIDHDNLNEQMDQLIDIVSKFKSTDSMEELDDDYLIEMINVLERALFTAVGIIYSRGQTFGDGGDCDHDEEDE